MAFVLDVNLRIQQILGLAKIKAQLAGTTGAGKGINIPVSVKDKDVQNVKNLGRAAVVTGASLTTASVGATKFGQQMFLAGKRYLAFITATAVPLAIFAAFAKSTQAVIEFDKEMIGLSQVLNTTVDQLGELRALILDLAAATGTGRKEIASLAKTLSQAGLRGQELTDSLTTLSKVPLVATFEDSASATQTFLAAINQFNKEGLTAEILFDKLTAVSKEFAVSAEDLGEAFKKAGGAFSAIGGNSDELIAAFTAIRAVTRETSSTVATSLKTLTARLRDLKRIEFIEEKLGINIRDANGALLPFLDTIKRIKPAFEAASTETKALIATSLGGFRQISRVFALLSDQGIKTFTESLEFSKNAAGAFSRDAVKGLETISAKFGQLKGELEKIIQSLSGPVFAPLIEGAINVAKAFASIGESLGPILPFMLQFVAFTGGIKILAGALKLLPGLLKTIAGINIAGALGGLKGIGAGAGAVAGAGFAGQIIPVAETRRAKAAMLGVANAGKRLIASSTGQIIALGAATIALNALQNSAEKSGNTTLAMAASVLKVIAGLTLLTTVLTGKTIQELTKSLGGLKNALGGLAAAFVIGFAIQGTIRAAAIQTELENKVKEAISKIDVNFSKTTTLEKASGELFASIVKTIQEAGAAVDPTTFGGLFTALGNRANDLLTGIVEGDLGTFSEAFGRATIGTREIEGFVNAALSSEANRAKFREILGEGINKFGSDFEQGLIASSADLLEKLTGVKVGEDAAKPIVEAFLRAASSLDFASAQEIAIRVKVQKQEQVFLDNLKIVAEDLGGIKIPETIGSDLNALDEGIKKVVEGLATAVSNFDKFTGIIGGIAGPSLDLTVTPEAARNIAIESGLDALIDIIGSDDVSKAARTFGSTVELLNDFIDQLENTNIPNRLQELGAGSAEAGVIIRKALGEFLSGIEDVSPEIASALQGSAIAIIREAQEAFEQGDFSGVRVALNALVSEDLVQAAEAAFGESGPALSEAFQTLVNTLLEGFQVKAGAVDLDLSVLVAELEIVTAKAIASGRQVALFSESMGKVGRALNVFNGPASKTEEEIRKIAPAMQFFGETIRDTEGQAISVATSFGALQSVMDRLREESVKEAEAFNAVQESARGTGENLGELIEAHKQQQIATIEARNAIVLYDAVVASAGTGTLKLTKIQELAQEGVEKLRVKEEELIQVRIAGQQARFEPENVFKDAVADFRESVNTLIRNVSPTATASAGGSEGITGQEPSTIIVNAQGTVSIQGQQISKELSNIVEKAGFGASLEEVDTILRKAITDQINASELLTIAFKNIGTDIDPLAFTEFLSAEDLQTVAQQAFDALKAKFGTDLAGGFTLGQEQINNLFTNLEDRIQSLLAAEGLTLEIKLSDAARSTLEKGIKTEGGDTTGAAEGQLFIDVLTPAAEKLQQGAQQFQESNQTFQQASEALGLGAENMGTSAAALNISAAESLSAATELRGAIAMLNEGVGGEQQTQKFDEFKQVQEEAKQAIETGNQLLEDLTKSVNNQTEVIEKQQDEPIEVEIEGLDANTDATVDSNETVSTNTNAVENLDDRLQKTNDNLSEGIDLKVDAVQELNVNIRGLEGAIETLKPQFAEVATLAAERVVAAALAQLAAAAGDHESRTNFQNTADGLA